LEEKACCLFDSQFNLFYNNQIINKVEPINKLNKKRKKKIMMMEPESPSLLDQSKQTMYINNRDSPMSPKL